MFETLKNVILLAFMLGLIIAIHEFGHLVAAKMFGVYVSEYAIGMGPTLFSKQYGETKYSLRAFPLGGFCAIAGDSEGGPESEVDISNIPPERTLTGISPLKRIVVMLAGVFMNCVLAWVIFAMIILSNGYYATSSKPVILAVQENSPAMNAGIKEGDIVEKVELPNGLSISTDSYTELVSFLSTYEGDGAWKMKMNRDGERIDIEVAPEYIEAEERYMIGIGFGSAAVDVKKVNIFNSLIFSLDYMKTMLKIMISSLVSIFVGKIGVDNLSGPVGIYSTVKETATLGFSYYIQLIAVVSLNIGLMNLIPLPVFDGGRVVLTTIEMIIGRPINKKFEAVIMSISLAIMLFLIIFVTYNDIGKIIGG